jgi:hypothetical protein
MHLDLAQLVGTNEADETAVSQSSNSCKRRGSSDGSAWSLPLGGESSHDFDAHNPASRDCFRTQPVTRDGRD